MQCNSQATGEVDCGNFQLGCQCRALRSSDENRLGVVLLPDLPALSGLVHHAVWIMNRYVIGRDGATPSERHKGRPHRGESCQLFEVVHWLVPASKQHKPDSRASMGIWLGKFLRGQCWFFSQESGEESEHRSTETVSCTGDALRSNVEARQFSQETWTPLSVTERKKTKRVVGLQFLCRTHLRSVKGMSCAHFLQNLDNIDYRHINHLTLRKVQAMETGEAREDTHTSQLLRKY